MIPLSIDGELRRLVPGACVGLLQAQVRVVPQHAELWEEIDQRVREMGERFTLESLRHSPQIRALWTAYKALGNDPTRYRGSSESLGRRIVQGKGLYQVNSLVDINNLVSLESLFSVGTVDLDRVQPPVVFRAGRDGESYAGIGRGQIKMASIPLFADASGPFASTTSDSERSMVTLQTTRILMLVISFGGPDGLPESLRRATDLLIRYAEAQQLETAVVT